MRKLLVVLLFGVLTCGVSLGGPNPPNHGLPIYVSSSAAGNFSRSVVKGETTILVEMLLTNTGAVAQTKLHKFWATIPQGVENIAVYHGTQRLEAKITTGPKGAKIINLQPHNSVALLPGTMTRISIRGKIGPGIAAGERLQATALVAGNSFVPAVNQNQVRITGGELTVVDHGQLFVAQSATTPSSGLLNSDDPSVTVFAVSVLSQNEDVLFTSLPIYVVPLNGGGPDQFESVKIYADGKLVGDAPSATSDNHPSSPIPLLPSGAQIALTTPVVVNKNTSKTLVFKVATSSVDGYNGSRGQSGQGFNLLVPGNELSCIGLTSNQIFTATGSAQSADFYLVRSQPLVIPNDQQPWTRRAVDQGLTGGVSWRKLYAVSVVNTGHYNIGMGLLTFQVATNNVEVLEIKLFDIYGRMISDGTLFNGTVRFAPRPMTVAAGGSMDCYVYGLLRTPGGVATSASISVSLLNDATFKTPLPENYIEALSNQFIWTDFAANPVFGEADAAVFQHKQWFGGYLLRDSTGNILPPVSVPAVQSR